ncbi:MAG: sigma-70 family RNA polymerase sigma factor [Rhodobacteraceae bacterium]|nr:MAG: sigma-70 family RNA polymerase sigma factor [Paracoccaceae bacterium]
MGRETTAPADQTQLLARFASGEMRAAEALTDLIAPRLLRYAARMLGDSVEAEDIVQETMLRLWRIAPEWQEGQAQPMTWAFRVAANLCTDRLRRRRGGVPEMPELADETPGMDARIMTRARAEALQAALMCLPERQREAVVLRHLEGLSNPEIADIMMVGVQAVESLTARGKRRLAHLLSGHREELGYHDEH